MSALKQCCTTKCGPGYESPTYAFKFGPREKLLYVTCIQPNIGKDYIAVVEVDPCSSTYSSVISRAYADSDNDEFHHMGWNSCSSRFCDSSSSRDKLIVPTLNSDKIYIFETSNPREPKLFKVIDNIKSKWKCSALHTVHCLASKEIMISCMGDKNGNEKGSFLLIQDETFEVVGYWSSQVVKFGYDFWYQPRLNVMVSSEWGSPNSWKMGLLLEDMKQQKYGQHLHFWNWETKQLIKSIDLGSDGLLPLEVRFLHNPSSQHGYVGCAFSSSIFHFYQDSKQEWKAEKVIQIKPKKVTNWLFEDMPAIATDILISMDDRFLYFSNWIHGDIRQYEITDPFNPQFYANVFIGGSLCNDTLVKVVSQEEQPVRPVIKDKSIQGGPQMLQLSLDGKRLYVTNSLYTSWDKQFYPQMVSQGSTMIQIDIDVETKSLKINPNFLIDFGSEPNGPILAHEMRYPGGDCTSDIWC